MSRQTFIKNQMPKCDHRDQSERDFMSEGRVEEKVNTESFLVGGRRIDEKANG